MNKNEIYIKSGTNYKEMTKELLAQCGLASVISDKKMQIGIKPNLVSPSEASWGATTHPEIVAGIIEYLQENGYGNIAILEGSWVGDKTIEAYEVRTESMQTRNEPVRAREPFMEMQWKIGNVQIDNPFVLAPMAGVTDLPFRTLCKEQGAGLICMEMISAKAISFHNKNTIALMEIDPCEHPVSMQLFGSEPDLMAEVAKSIEDRDFDILDINMGCPVPKVVNNGEGSALLKNPNLIEEIVRKVSSAISKPLTVKVRIGFENEPVDIVEIAKRIEDAGAAALAVHGRTRQQYYSGTADWDTIRRVKEAITIPVIGNGDVDSPLKAEALVKQTGCDAVMVGRAVRGNPWLFRELNHYFRTGELLERPSVEEIREMILRHARKQIELKGEFVGIREMRKHVAWYTAGMRHSAGLRRESNTIESYEALEALLSRLA